jgi:biopolymer transport protein ExbD
MMTHAVKLDMPGGPPAETATPPEVISLDIDFDGTLAWNGRTLTFSDLERSLESAARKNPQPEIHLHADRHVKYNFVAQVLASAQRHGMRRMGFENTGEYSE